ncbi:pilus assembly FimT family protein [Stieleria varia]|uniref:Uncharacterized protein n=1 Tax=Stieleria varia TaxID=2528005 RepID=A0A5C6B786_9BACT|nr:prepilin-type N-terminal cleavage/methylation domain-containing protein [Stieleria varia]TWU07647.1 hypothetical protein Pla52n_02200 [Stieleria varia]
MNRQPKQTVRGFTLVELLVALTIAVVLTAIALPSVKDALRQNIVARAAAVVKGAFLNARAQAIRTGRPFGVVIERQRDTIGAGTPAQLNFFNANYASRLYYVQTPLLYRGDLEESAAYIFIGNSSANQPQRFFIPRVSAGVLNVAARGANGADRILSAGTKMSVGRSGSIFEITRLIDSDLTPYFSGQLPSWAIDNTVAPPAPIQGTVVEFNNAGYFPTYAIPGDLQLGQPYPFEIIANPVRAPLMPISLVGKTAVDLSISGPASAPMAFGTQAILGNQNLAADQAFGPITVMFSPEGQVDAVYTDTVVGGVVSRLRINPATTISFNVGYIDGVLSNIDDGARYPDVVPNTVFPNGANDPPLALPLPPEPLQVTKVPNFANSDCAWVSVQPLSGAVTLSTIAAQPSIAELSAYYGLGTSPPARSVMWARLHQSRRLTTAGVVQ